MWLIRIIFDYMFRMRSSLLNSLKVSIKSDWTKTACPPRPKLSRLYITSTSNIRWIGDVVTAGFHTRLSSGRRDHPTKPILQSPCSPRMHLKGALEDTDKPTKEAKQIWSYQETINSGFPQYVSKWSWELSVWDWMQNRSAVLSSRQWYVNFMICLLISDIIGTSSVTRQWVRSLYALPI